MSGHWSKVDIAGKTAEVFEPSAGKARFALIYLHGVGQESLREKERYAELLERHSLGCIVPQGGYTWWSDKLLKEYDPSRSAEGYVLNDVVLFAQQRWNLAERAIGLFGISMGGQGALRMAFKYPARFPVVAGISPAIDHYLLLGQGLSLDEMYDSKEQCRQDSVTLNVHPIEYPRHIFFCCDPDDADWHRGVDRLHEKLSALGIAHQCDLTTRAGGHNWEYYNAIGDRVFQFLRDGLEQESRRLL